jgi:hypothetical protein
MSEETFEPDDLDAMLRRVMKRRAEPVAPTDLARRAMKRAQAADALAAVARVNRLNRLFTAIAAVVIIAVAGWIFRARLSAGGFQPWSDTSVTSSDDSTTASAETSTTTTSTATQWMFVGIALSVTAIGVIAVQRTIGTSDEWILRWNASSRSARA